MQTNQQNNQSPLHNYESMSEEDYANLKFNANFTQRIGVLDGTKDIIGWICPECSSEFDLNNNIVYIYGENSAQGEA